MKAMILAAGRGERMRPLTDDRPKPMIAVAGRPLIGWHLERLAQAGCHEVVINLAYRGAQIREYVGDGGDFGLGVRYSDEGEHGLETGGGIHNALPVLAPDGCDRPFMVINGDVYTDYPLGCLCRRAEALPPNALAHLVMVPNPPHNPAGDFTLAGERVLAGDVRARLTFSGLGCYRASLFAGITDPRQAFRLAPLLRRAAARGAVSGECHTGLWSDVGTPERLADLEKILYK